MSVLVDQNTRVLIQGITGREGTFHARGCREYGTKIVAGVTPGRGGTVHEDVPVFDTVRQAVQKTGAEVSLIFVPPASAADASDMVTVRAALRDGRTRLIGPNCPGIISPGKCKIGIMPGYIHKPGPAGVLSRSGTLTYEAVAQLTRRGIGQSTCIGIGGDPIIGTTFVDALKLFREDEQTRAIVLIGEIGGGAEEEAARWAASELNKPMVAFVAGQTAPPGRRMGHAGAIIAGGHGTAAEKMAVLQECGARVLQSPAGIGEAVEAALKDGARAGGTRGNG